MAHREVVVSDATEFMCLERYPEGFAYLSILFDKVLIPTQVAEELVQKSGLSHQAYLSKWGISERVEIVSVTLNPLVPGLLERSTKGEAYSISLALDRGLKLMVEDKKARNFARRCGVLAVRMGFFVVAAHRQGHIDLAQARSMLLLLHQSNMYNQLQYQDYLSKLQAQ